MYRLALVFLVLSGTVSASVVAKWEAEIIHPDQEVKKYAPLNEEFQLNLGKSNWSCKLGEGKTVKKARLKIATRNMICSSGENSFSTVVQCMNTGNSDTDAFASVGESLILVGKEHIHQVSVKCSVL